MANEFVARNGIIALDDSQITGSLNVSNGITGSLFGTASFAVTSSFSVSSSRAISSSFATSASVAISSSFSTSASVAISSSFATSASVAVSSSFATTASFVQIFPFTGSAIISGSLQVTGSTSISGSFTVLTGSGIEFQVTNVGTKIGNVLTDIHTVTGSLIVSNSLSITGSLNGIAINSYAQAASGGFSKSFAIINSSNIQATDVGTFSIWRCNVPCTASMVLMYQDSGSSVAVNALKNATTLLSSNLTNTSLDTWVSSSTLQNQNFAIGDILNFQLVSFSGNPKEITIQTSFTY